jgi:arrestin-related trafficking adapter 4/5/7
MGRFSLSSQPRPLKSGPGTKSFIEVVLDSPYLTLKGTGPDVEATRLSGNVVLYLAEASSIREITLEFRGKARIPIPGQESCVMRQFIGVFLLTSALQSDQCYCLDDI